MTEYNKKLEQLRADKAKKARLESILKDLNAQHSDLEQRLALLGKEKQKQQSDVERLEGRSLAVFYYALVGKRDELLDKERREAYAAAVKYDAALRELEAVEADIKSFELELRSVRDCERQYAEVLRQKQEYIKASGIPQAEEIEELEQKLSFLYAQRAEIDEAVTEGKKAYGIAKSVLSELNSAEGWGTYDLVSGGLLSHMAKHEHLDDAQERVEQLQVQLRRFKTELADITVHADLQVNIEGFLRFADYFFDNLFTDWAVLDRINRSQEQVGQTLSEIKTVLNRLSDMSNASLREINKLRAQIDIIVREA